MNEDIFAAGTLNKSVAFGAVKPLNCTLLSHKQYSFRLYSKKFSCCSTAREKRLLLCRDSSRRNKKGVEVFPRTCPSAKFQLHWTKTSTRNSQGFDRELPRWFSGKLGMIGGTPDFV